jgi:hypothetical protein
LEVSDDEGYLYDDEVRGDTRTRTKAQRFH